jgi:hypothetical protein
VGQLSAANRRSHELIKHGRVTCTRSDAGEETTREPEVARKERRKNLKNLYESLVVHGSCVYYGDTKTHQISFAGALSRLNETNKFKVKGRSLAKASRICFRGKLFTRRLHLRASFSSVLLAKLQHIVNHQTDSLIHLSKQHRHRLSLWARNIQGT